MNRREFVRSACLLPSAFAVSPLTVRADVRVNDNGMVVREERPLVFIGEMRLHELLAEYRMELMEDIAPSLMNYCVDMENGGIMYPVRRDGTPSSPNRMGLYQGRGLWTLARLYNRHGKDERHLDAARKLRAFIKRYAVDGSGDMYYAVTPAGEPVSGDLNVLADIDAAAGLVEYYRATKEADALADARAVLFRTLDRVLAPAFMHRPGYEPGTSVLVIWVHYLRAIELYLETMPIDVEASGVARMSLRRILDHHVDGAAGFVCDNLEGATLQPFSGADERFGNVGTASQSAWIVMDEAARARDTMTFRKAANLLRAVVAQGWDREYGGLADTIYPERPEYSNMDKTLRSHCETMLALLRYIEYTNDQWAVHWFATLRAYYREVFHDEARGGWFVRLERSGAHSPDTPNLELLHHPRSVMLAIECIERMIERGGQTPDFPAKG